MMRMKRIVAALLASLLLSSCGIFGGGDIAILDKAKLPRNDVAGVAAALKAAVDTPDLDLDGTVNGLTEWIAFFRTLVQTYQSAKK